VYAQWIPTNGPREGLAFSLAVGTTGVGDTCVFAGTSYGSVFRTSDNGNSWTEIDGGTWWAIPQDTGFTSKDIYGLFACSNGAGGTSLFASTAGPRTYRSINGDTNWTDAIGGISHHCINSFIHVDTSILVGTDSGVFLSTTYGTNWIGLKNELSPYGVYSLVATSNGINGPTLFASTTGGIFLSTNGGVNWTTVNTEAQSYRDLVAGHNEKGSVVLYAFSGDGVFCSVDSGANWTATNIVSPYPGTTIVCLTMHDTILFAGTFEHGIFYSTNGGKTWIDGNSSMGRRSVFKLVIVGANLFAAVSSDIASIRSVWRRPLSEMPTGVGDKYEQNPTEFKLEQNYPNPFNPMTCIPFSIPTKSFVSLKIYDLIGRVTATIISEEMLAGKYLKRWNADELPSGVYFCELRAGSLIEMKKLLLLR
jgi:photosystem II stability/assembly factor-like uncharacterized protein